MSGLYIALDGHVRVDRRTDRQVDDRLNRVYETYRYLEGIAKMNRTYGADYVVKYASNLLMGAKNNG